MATQQEAINFIKSNYDTEPLESGGLKLVFDLGGGRSQLAFVEVNESNVQYSSPFASVDDVTAKQALEANSEYSVGMQIVGSVYVVKHVAPLGDLDASEINEGFELVANIADLLEKQLVGGDRY
jgi:hypothetical protein